MSTLGLDRLEELRREGRSLFHGERGTRPEAVLYPEISTISLDPRHARGVWVPKLGLLAPSPLVRRVFANGLVAAILATGQQRGGVVALHGDEFPDGTVALTFGENAASRGALGEAFRSASDVEDDALLGEYRVNVLPRKAFSAEETAYPFPGQYCSNDPVPVLEQVTLTAGDVRAIARRLGGGLLSLDDSEVAHAAPFEGPFARGGDLQFNPLTGEQLAPRVPTPTDRKIALSLIEERGQRWLQLRLRLDRRPRRDLAHQALVERSVGVPGTFAPHRPKAFRQALQFIEDNCTRRLSVAEIAEAARMSKTHLHRTFREIAGCSPLGYAAERRLDVAERMLRESKMSIGEISERCGFAEQASFTRSLKHRRGIAPSALRRLALLDSGIRSQS